MQAQFGDGTARSSTLQQLHELCKIMDPWKFREFQELAKQHSLSSIQLPYWNDWRFADPAIFFIPELRLLHTCHKFFWSYTSEVVQGGSGRPNCWYLRFLKPCEGLPEDLRFLMHLHEMRRLCILPETGGKLSPGLVWWPHNNLSRKCAIIRPGLREEKEVDRFQRSGHKQ